MEGHVEGLKNTRLQLVRAELLVDLGEQSRTSAGVQSTACIKSKLIDFERTICQTISSDAAMLKLVLKNFPSLEKE